MELEIAGLACRRGGRPVLRDVSFRLAGGAALIRGPNGAGKSSLLRVLAGLVPASAGEARLGGHTLSAGTLPDLVAYAGHRDAAKAALSVRQNLDIWAGLFEAPPGSVDRALEAFALEPIAGRIVAECSAGQARRLGLARLVLLDRPLWLLDEPTVSLDAASCAVLDRLVEAHVAAGGLALIATHVPVGVEPVAVLTLAHIGPSAAAEDAFLDGSWT